MAKTTEIRIEPLRETSFDIELIGDTDLILNKKARYYEQSEVWKQSNDKGTEPPAIFKQGKNVWEQLITSIRWRDPIEYHDEDISLYSEEEWRDYMENNAPCILPIAFSKSFAEAFVTFFKDSTGKNGTDLKRSVSMIGRQYPIKFASVEPVQTLVPTTGLNRTQVLASYNVFSGWSTRIQLSCVNAVFPPATVLSLIQTTGRYIGIGTQRGNGYGKYHLGEIKTQETK